MSWLLFKSLPMPMRKLVLRPSLRATSAAEPPPLDPPEPPVPVPVPVVEVLVDAPLLEAPPAPVEAPVELPVVLAASVPVVPLASVPVIVPLAPGGTDSLLEHAARRNIHPSMENDRMDPMLPSRSPFAEVVQGVNVPNPSRRAAPRVLRGR